MHNQQKPKPDNIERFAGSMLTTQLPDPNCVEVLLYTGAAVDRVDWSTGSKYQLTLSLDPAHCNFGMLNGAPLLDTHMDYAISSVYGSFSDAQLTDRGLVATAKFSQRPEVQAILADVKDGILQQVSVGAVIRKLKDITPEGETIKSYLAIDWFPREGSLVPIAADCNAGFLSATEVVIGLVEERASAHKDDSMNHNENSGQAGTAQPALIDQSVLAAERSAERERQAEIRRLGRAASFAQDDLDAHLSSEISVEAFSRLALERLAATQRANDTRQHHDVSIQRDERETFRGLVSARIMNLFDSKHPVDAQNEFRNLGVYRLAEECVGKMGRNPRHLSKSEVVELSMHGTSDFPLILADSARKQMLNMYMLANPTYKIWAKASTTPDFKTMSRLRLSETPTFLQVPEGAQITLGTMTESREQYALATYGRGVSFTRQMLINDDLGAFLQLISAFGMQAARIENKTVYAILQANAAMSDAVALFHATHGNLGAGAIGNTGLDSMFISFRTQVGLDGKSVLNLVPKYLITPAAKASTATNALTASGNNLKPADQNWFAGLLTPVADAELDLNGSGASVWFGAADPAIAPGIEYAHLEGANGPQMIRKDNEDAILGVQLYAYLDFAAKAVDWRPLYKSSGV